MLERDCLFSFRPMLKVRKGNRETKKCLLISEKRKKNRFQNADYDWSRKKNLQTY
jgi:hypothetical protein